MPWYIIYELINKIFKIQIQDNPDFVNGQLSCRDIK